MKMNAAAIDRFGPPSALKLRHREAPRPARNEVLIAVHTAGVGVWDESMRTGEWKISRPRFPLVLGADGSGTVVARGGGVRRLRNGDRVYAYEAGNPKGGFYAEYVAVKAQHAARIPRGLTLKDAGAAAVTALTALQGVKSHLRLGRHETVLIFGASGAVGTLAIQFAKRCGARVLATGSGKPAAKLLARLGADAVIDARSKESIELLRRHAPRGIDAVLALAGGRELERFLGQLKGRTRLVHPNGIEPAPRRRRQLLIRGYDVVAGPREFARLERALRKVRLRVPIAATYPLARAAHAHRRLARGHVLGRIVLGVKRSGSV